MMLDIFSFVYLAILVVIGLCAAVFVVSATALMLKDLFGGEKDV